MQHIFDSFLGHATIFHHATLFLCHRDIVLIDKNIHALEMANLRKSDDFAAPLQEIKELCGNFISFSISFIRQEANIVAHRYAKQASEVRRRYLWISFLSDFLRDCITSNVVLLSNQ
jgi:hypothetical protein